MKHRITLLFLVCALAGSINTAFADLREGLVSYWPLDVLTNDVNLGQNVTPDLGPNTNFLSDNGTMSGADIVPGMRGNAASFDGVAKYLSRIYTIGEDNGLPIYNARYYTIAMWVRDGKYLSGTNQQTKAVFAEANNVAGTVNSLFRLTTDWAPAGRTNLLAAAIRDNFGSWAFGNFTFGDLGKSTVSTNMPFDGNWHHIAWVDSNGVARLYVDGQLDPRVFKNTRLSEPQDVVTANPANRGLTLNTFSLGAVVSTTIGNYFYGLIDDAAVWERTLTQDEINQVRSNGIPTPILTSAPSITNQPAGNTNLLVGQFFGLQSLALGTHPRTYQWYKDGALLLDLVETNESGEITNAPITGTTSNLLVLTNLQTSYSGDYTVVVSNNYGSVTSSVATLLVSTVSPQTASLTNGQISYWPLDQVQGITTPDVVRGYDMLLGTPAAGTMGLSSANVVPGKWGNAFKFNTNGILSRIHSPGDDLPISQYRNFTVSAWINAPTNSAGNNNAGARYFAEGNLSTANPWLSLGHVDNLGQVLAPAPAGTSARFFVRNDANQNNSTVPVTLSSLPVFYDPSVSPGGEWHHVVYIQEEVGGALPLLTARVYVDGVRDTGFVGSPRIPRSVQNTTIGGALRTGITGAFGGGMIDDVSVWNRALTDEEIVMLSTNVTPAAPAVIQPLQITSFRADFPEVVSGDNLILRWAVSSSAAQVDIDQGIGSVVSRTTNGFGSITVSNVTSSATYTLTIQRAGSTNVTAQTSVAVVTGVAAGWNILDNFQTYGPGAFVNPYWSDLNGGLTVEDIGGNRMLNSPGGQTALLPLSTLAINQGQARTIFARVYVQDDPAIANMLNEIGVTDKSLRSPNDLDGDAGPIVRLYDDPAGDLAIGARNGVANPANPITLVPRKLEYQQVYNLWIDITNGPFTTAFEETNHTGDTFSIWLQRLGETSRMLIASNWTTDRDLLPDFLTATGLHLNQLAVGNDGGATGSVYVDDLYISKSGYNSTVPASWAGPTPPALTVPTLTADTASVPGQITFTWDAGALMSAPALTGPWSVVTNAFGFNYTAIIAPAVPQEYFRVQR